ncbi:TlpA family protein disulfide reductase [Lutibacter sp.]
MKFFSVGLIPRSILIDKEGKIITQHAPKPSSKEIKPYLNKLLSKNSLLK